MEWIPATISGLYNQFFLLLVIFVLGSLLVHILLFNRRTRKYRSAFRRMKKQQQESQLVLKQRNQLRDRTKVMNRALNMPSEFRRPCLHTPAVEAPISRIPLFIRKPKDIVSGDFYWARRINGKMFFSVADCTGHGVPGAFMSLIGLEFFRQISSGRRESSILPAS